MISIPMIALFLVIAPGSTDGTLTTLQEELEASLEGCPGEACILGNFEDGTLKITPMGSFGPFTRLFVRTGGEEAVFELDKERKKKDVKPPTALVVSGHGGETGLYVRKFKPVPESCDLDDLTFNRDGEGIDFMIIFSRSDVMDANGNYNPVSGSWCEKTISGAGE